MASSLPLVGRIWAVGMPVVALMAAMRSWALASG